MTPTILKYAAWLTAEAASVLIARLADQQIALHEARKAVCTPLSGRVDVGLVAPETWRATRLCRRPLSWYWMSPFAGLFLVISKTPLNDFGVPPQIVLRKSAFRSPAAPSEDEQRRMVQRPSYQKARPVAWEDLNAQDAAEQERWMRTMGIRGKRFEDLFLTHCANHANFIEPEYYVQYAGVPVPCSIAPTNQVCSACLEFFNVIGAEFSRKLVVPCPGAVIYAGLPVNRYIEVETLVEAVSNECREGEKYCPSA